MIMFVFFLIFKFIPFVFQLAGWKCPKKTHVDKLATYCSSSTQEMMFQNEGDRDRQSQLVFDSGEDLSDL